MSSRPRAVCGLRAKRSHAAPMRRRSTPLFTETGRGRTLRSMQTLDREDRLQLMKFICSFAWADLEVQKAERKFVGKLARELELDEDEQKQVEAWLEVPPTPDEVDPQDIPKAHRELFLDTVRAIIVADGKIDAEEAENFSLLEAMLR